MLAPMADPSLGPPGAARIFISYRRRETAGHAGRLNDRLADHFGDERVFMDIEMEAGVDFVDQINAAVGSSGALIVLIGEEWLTVTDAAGHRRIEDPTDVHRVEVEAALNRDVRVIPALVQGARMPLEQELPEALRPLARRQAVELSDQRWDYDVDRLIAVLERVLAAAVQPRVGDRLRRLRDGVARALVRHPWRIYAAGLASGLLLAVAVLAATGYFGAPLLTIAFADPQRYAATLARSDRCPVRIESEYTIKAVRFALDGDDLIVEERDPPFQCDNTGRGQWNTCFSRMGHRIRPGRHRLSATVVDFHDNAATATVDVTTPRCAGSP
jgi:hypothetical protein